jgi:peptide-methionine (R)-S-oxide reductase
MMKTTKEKVSPEALRSRLTPEQYRITQEKGTEPAYSGEYVDCKDDGTYSCVVCSNPLFRSDTKYDYGSGWPSFWLPLVGDRVRTHLDESFGMRREEVLCANCDAHLGHVFPDGPQPGSDRFCINSASLSFATSDEVDDDEPAPATGGA